MTIKRILFISGSVGLGHIIRDIAIVEELRKKLPNLQVDWIAKHPASIKLQEKGETILNESDDYSNETIIAESLSHDFSLDLSKYILGSMGAWWNNVKVFNRIMKRTQYDLVIGDETYDLALALSAFPKMKKTPFIMIYDFLGMDTTDNGVIQRAVTYSINVAWSKIIGKKGVDLSVFIGMLEDIPDISFGFLLPNRRDYAKQEMNFVGNIISFNKDRLDTRVQIRKQLGYSEKPWIICTIGGTSVGKKLLDLCTETSKLLGDEYQVTLVAGPRVELDSINYPDWVNVCGYVSDLYRYFYASDLVITQAGGSTTMELAYLGKPFAYFPVKDHFEQEIHVSGKLSRLGVGHRMSIDDTSPHDLSSWVKENIGNECSVSGEFNGAELTSNLISNILIDLEPDIVF